MGWRPLDQIVPSPGLFRLLLAFDVIASHLTRLDVGRLAVMLFFYLSGYWTLRIWIEKFEGLMAGQFYLARYLRIAPLYFLVMLAAALAKGEPIHAENLSLLGVASSSRDPTGVAWSLDIELQFYLLLPLVATMILATRAWTSLAAAVALAALGVWLQQAFGVVTVAKYMPPFVLGALTFAKDWRPGGRTAALGLAGFALATLIAAASPFFSKDVPDPFDRDLFAMAWMAPLLPFVAYSLTRPSGRLDRHLGNLSYPIYLVHAPIIGLAERAGALGVGAKALVAFAAVTLAIGVYLLVDRPVDAWRVQVTEAPLKLYRRLLARQDVEEAAGAERQQDGGHRQHAA